MMVIGSPSPLSLVAAAIYLVVILSSTLAAGSARQNRQSSWHYRGWLFIAVLFTLLAALRVLALEDYLREVMRGMLQAEGSYADRRSIQKPIVAALIAGISALAFWLTYRFTRKTRKRRDIATMLAMGGALAMILLLILRLISLHAVDYLLYGPAKFNWIIDLGASVTIIASAFYYRRISRSVR